MRQVQDRVPVEDGLDAPGNLGSGRMRIARINFDAPLARLGIRGGRLKARLSVVDTSVKDPYTLRNRHFTDIHQQSAQRQFVQPGRCILAFQTD